MKKLLIATVIGALSSTMLVAAPDAFAQASAPAAAKKATAKKPTPHRRARARAPEPRHRLVRRSTRVAAGDPIPEGSVRWTCEDGLSFLLKGDMKRDQIVTVHWGDRNYNLPRETTTTGADRFHDAASGLDLVVIPTKAMLLSDKDDTRLADECKTAEMLQGSPAPTQSNELNRTGQ
ncbi:hypothetical protein CY652_18500 [Burkholderia sp. WAC0059]|uniref:hypothetical protein n=1 Tax=Burkholderia sp. WAC0059 TaxID=2066022 RepID=UPI000C7F791B|nr:hypothetical protein [Burkholderia sp. WAC0059]PLZ00843.1 hypothetical protein CY652_18500 [Burkholderia sp. WAC0059]